MAFPEHFVKLITECITSPTFSVCVNGESCGYFKGAKGLRQGESISPYLFTIAMDVFTQMLTSKFNTNHIGFHPQASNPQVPLLAFADDIMIFFDGKKTSLENISTVLQQFSILSGLSMNKDKTNLYLAGVNQDETSQFHSLGFNLGSLPIHYLGLPLIHRKLRISEYRPLIDKITGKFSSWTARALSFPGRKELISSVIYGIINLWASAFILPKGCVKIIESLCTRFLCCGDISKKTHAKVAWSSLCLPKEKGGLGFRSINRWNKTLCLKLIWRLLTAGDSLWADWLRNNKIKDEVFWQIDAVKQTSWICRTILHLRSLALIFLRCHVGNGQTTSFWNNSWTPFGHLLDYMGTTGPSQTGVPLRGTVAQACSPNGWIIRPTRSLQAEAL
ncbi:PREDICTED: uncharacterized protein LOC104779191 [Camelina sativa]|uniref:Uncharacterized protein LOC104779191 n=1 Tax=Camelina sativa TaxID=90675 RepID=A0ABM0YJD4_CAMSA|nr:PREDICTED: uncharacterized protein LOC104779191 [Camelina sativa]